MQKKEKLCDKLSANQAKNHSYPKRYYVRKPTDRRVSFALVEAVRIDGKEHKHTIENPEFDSINHLLKTGVIGYETALAKCEEVRKFLNAQFATIPDHHKVYAKLASPSNMKLLNEYWENVYGLRLINLEDPRRAKDKLYRAVRAIGSEIDLITSSHQEIANHIINLKCGPNQKREIVSKLNQLLKYAKRNFTVSMPKKVKPKVKYITEVEFLKFIQTIDDIVYRAIYTVAFYSGARRAEILAMTEAKIQGEIIYIDEQVYGAIRKAPKWGSVRWAYAFPEAIAAIKVLDIARDEKRLPSEHQVTKQFKADAVRFFKGSKESLCFHDLRHSYAIHLLGLKAPIEAIAQSLGNSVAVCQEYYLGKSVTTPTAQLISNLVKTHRQNGG